MQKALEKKNLDCKMLSCRGHMAFQKSKATVRSPEQRQTDPCCLEHVSSLRVSRNWFRLYPLVRVPGTKRYKFLLWIPIYISETVPTPKDSLVLPVVYALLSHMQQA